MGNGIFLDVFPREDKCYVEYATISNDGKIDQEIRKCLPFHASIFPVLIDGKRI